MPTGDKHVDIYNKQLLPQQGWNQYFFRYLDEKVDASTRSAFLSAGVLSDKTIGLGSSANDTFSADITNASRGVDDAGHVMDLANLLTSEVEDIAFENAVGVTYYVGFRYQQVPDGIERNARSAEPEYPWALDHVGELGNPDTVSDGGTYIRLDVDGILEAGVDHKNQVVRVWLGNPVSPVLAVAYYDGVVEYDGTNFVQIPYTPTAGPLGQTAPTYSISTTTADYWVQVRGLSWFRNTDISSDGTYVFLGTAQGSGAGTTPTVFDINCQVATFLISLQRAYYGNSTDDPAPGRSIWAHRGAVKIRQSASAAYEQDLANAALWIDKQDETVNLSVDSFTLHSDDTLMSGHDITLKSLNDGVSGNLQKLEAATIIGNTITFTRGGVDLTAFADFFRQSVFVLVENTTGGTHDGLYLGDSITANTLTVNDLDFGPPTWPADTVQVRVFFTVWGHFIPSFQGTSYSDFGNTIKAVPRDGDGLALGMIGAPASGVQNRWIKAGAIESDQRNEFYYLLGGRLLMRGGGSRVNQGVFDDLVRGHASYGVDKVDTVGLSTSWQPNEDNDEWGFDYRGNDFGKGAIGVDAGKQLAASFRMPLTEYDGGAKPLLAEESFTSLTALQLNFTRAGFDNATIPIGGTSGAGRGWVLVEVQFDTPHSSDGVYLVTGVSGGTAVNFATFNNASPGFPTGQTGVCRFYGGAFFGTASAIFGGQGSWVETIVPPSQGSGGLRIAFNGEDAIGSTEYRFSSLIHGYSDGLEMWGVRDGGVMFSRAMTTRAWKVGHELTQWDMVDTAYVNTDLVLSDLYTGTLARFAEIDFVEGTYDATLPLAQTSCNVFKQDGGGSWTVVKLLNIFRISSSIVGGTPAWHSPTSSGYITAGSADSGGKIPIVIPHGATLDSVSVYVDPITGDGTAASFGVDIKRKAHTSTVVIGLRSSNMLYTSIPTLHNFIVTTDQNKVIDNTSNMYWIEIRSSDTAGDLVYTCRCEYTVSKLGEHFFDCI